MSLVRAHQNEPLDALCHRAVGRTAGVTEQTLRLNRGLAALGPLLPQGTPVEIPEQPAKPVRRDTVQLWD
jgi:phage tail protein X